jgi:hypothetical protein
MPTPSPLGLPPGFWEEYRKRIEPDLAQLRHHLFPLEAGKTHLRDGENDWTHFWIARFRRVIRNYETILDAMNNGDLR